jgi:hypothetical protein
MDDYDAAVFAGEFVADGSAVVWGTVIDQDHFNVFVRLRQNTGNTFA